MAATTDTEREGRWVVKASQASRDAINPVRGFEENLFKDVLKERRTDIEFIKLSIGDTAALPVHPAVPEAVKKVLESGGCTGYGHSRGLPETRAALARLYSPFTLDPRGLTAEDVIMANACSGALEMCVTVLTEPGQNVLVPSPGFGLYSCLAGSRGIKCHFYKLQADRGWEVDLADLERQIDSETAALIVNNPSNPCGSSYSQQHLLDILAIAERHRLPIIADEIYAWMTFPGSEFHMLSSLSRTVPILSCSSLSKRCVLVM
jgi:tyrosine aminotransferase